MRRRLWLVTSALAVANVALADDWPTYGRTAARSNATSESLPLPLELRWTHTSANPPRRAWPGPARRDAYSKIENLSPRLGFDAAFHVAVADGRVYFGSSSEDKLVCLDLATGEPVWTFFADGPLRFAPVVEQGRVLFGSDDGRVYALDAPDGRLLWQYRAGPENRYVPGNGRMISVWPVRTGVVVYDGLAYFCAGMFPMQGTYLVALDAADGKERWKHKLNEFAPQGYLLASRTRLYVPTGRGSPFMFNRADGKLIRAAGGGGGTYALLTEDELISGPGKTGQLALFDGAGDDHLATFPGNHMIVSSGRAFMQTDTALSALDRTRYLELARERRELGRKQGALRAKLKVTQRVAAADHTQTVRDQITTIGRRLDQITTELRACLLWNIECHNPFSLILAGTTLLTGGDGSVAAYTAGEGKLVWAGEVRGKAYGLAVADGCLLVSTDACAIHCFAGPSQGDGAEAGQ